MPECFTVHAAHTFWELFISKDPDCDKKHCNSKSDNNYGQVFHSTWSHQSGWGLGMGGGLVEVQETHKQWLDAISLTQTAQRFRQITPEEFCHLSSGSLSLCSALFVLTFLCLPLPLRRRSWRETTLSTCAITLNWRHFSLTSCSFCCWENQMTSLPLRPSILLPSPPPCQQRLPTLPRLPPRPSPTVAQTHR